MAETIEVQCGSCHKRFRLLASQVDREVRCPHCKTAVRIASPVPPAEAASRGGQPPARRPPTRSRQPRRSRGDARPGRGHDARHGHGQEDGERPVIVSSPGIRTKSLAIVWAVVLALALGGVVTGLVIVLKDYDTPGSGTAAEGAGVATASAGGTASPAAAAGTGTGAPPTASGAGAAEAAPAPTGGGEGEAAAQPPRARPDVVGETLTVDIARLLRGYSGETVTYAVGHVTNNSTETIPALKIDVGLWVSEDGERVGTATAIILNLPPKYTAPIVAECRHNPGVRAMYWMLEGWDPSPFGVPRNLPPLETSGAVPLGDPNSVEPSGLIQAQVTNHGDVAVKDMLMYALLLDEKGKVVGAARHRASTKIEPGASGEVEIEWRHTAGTLVRNVEVWTQPYFYQAER